MKNEKRKMKYNKSLAKARLLLTQITGNASILAGFLLALSHVEWVLEK
jgi:hypothetical protein